MNGTLFMVGWLTFIRKAAVLDFAVPKTIRQAALPNNGQKTELPYFDLARQPQRRRRPGWSTKANLSASGAAAPLSGSGVLPQGLERESRLLWRLG